MCKHKKLRILAASLALQQVREVGPVTPQEEVTHECQIQIYIILPLTRTILGLVIFAGLHSRKLKLCRGCLFSSALKIMLCISDVQYYVPIKLCKTAGSIHLFKITGTLKSENVKLRQITFGIKIKINLFSIALIKPDTIISSVLNN